MVIGESACMPTCGTVFMQIVFLEFKGSRCCLRKAPKSPKNLRPCSKRALFSQNNFDIPKETGHEMETGGKPQQVIVGMVTPTPKIKTPLQSYNIHRILVFCEDVVTTDPLIPAAYEYAS